MLEQNAIKRIVVIVVVVFVTTTIIIIATTTFHINVSGTQLYATVYYKQ